MNGNQTERALVIIKPDGVAKRLVGRILARIEELNLVITNAKMVKLTTQDCQRLYNKTRHNLPHIYTAVEKHMTENFSIVVVVEGENAVEKVYKLRGPTNLTEAPIGTIRHDFIDDETRNLFARGVYLGNLMHASENISESEFEISLFFKKGR